MNLDVMALVEQMNNMAARMRLADELMRTPIMMQRRTFPPDVMHLACALTSFEIPDTMEISCELANLFRSDGIDQQVASSLVVVSECRPDIYARIEALEKNISSLEEEHKRDELLQEITAAYNILSSVADAIEGTDESRPFRLLSLAMVILFVAVSKHQHTH